MALRIHDKEFVPLISAEEIRTQVNRLGAELGRDFADKDPLFLIVLNGAFMFAADLMRATELDPDVLCIRLASYVDMQSTGKVREVIGLSENIEGRNIIVVEDIIDTGHTIAHLRETLLAKGAHEVHYAALLFKEEAFQYAFPIQYYCFRIPNKFVVGFGLDYNQRGRSLDAVYVLKDS